MPALISLAVLCRRISLDDEEGFTLHGLTDAVTLLDEAGPLRLLGIVWTLPRESGRHLVRAIVLAPSGTDASNEYRFAQMLEAGVPKKWTFEFEIEPDAEGIYQFVVEVGPGTEARFPLGVRWTPDSARARRRKPPE
jgi:hypothetical protein